MSRRIRRGRKGIDLPLKNPPASTDRVIGHDASGNVHQFLASTLGGFDIGALPNRATPASTDRFPLQTSGGTDYRTTLAGITTAVLGNISVVVNSNGTSVRIPEARLQLCWTTQVNSSGVNISFGNVFISGSMAPRSWPQAFSGAPLAIPQVVRNSGNAPFWFAPSNTGPSASQTPGGFVVAAISTSVTAAVSWFGIGRY